MFPATDANNGTVQLLTGTELQAALADIGSKALSAGAPVPSYADQRTIDGFGYTVSTQTINVGAGNYLIAELLNPSNSGVNFIMTDRAFSFALANATAPLEYARYSPASVLAASPTPTSVVVNNQISGGPVGAGTFRYQMGASLPTGGAITSGGFVPMGGEELRIAKIVIIPPGGKLLYAIGGIGGGLAASAKMKMTFLFYTRPV